MTGGRAPWARLSSLLAGVATAERLSRDVAAHQSRVAPHPALRRALRAQARQEAAHAALFEGAIRLTGVVEACPPRLALAFARFEHRLHDDLDRGDFAASMLGLHTVLEGLGGVAMQAPIGQLGYLGASIVPLRSLVLQQEAAHQRLGEVWMPRLSDNELRLRAACSAYLELAESVLEAGLEALDGFVGDQQAYRLPAQEHFERVRQLHS